MALTAAYPSDKFIAMQGDVTSSDTLNAFLRLGCFHFDRIDGLVNKAGIRESKDFFDLSREDWDSVILTNLTSCFEAMQIFGRHIVMEGGQ